MENVFEFITGDEIATLTIHQKRFVNRIWHLKKKYPEQVEIVKENEDGTLLVHLPVDWLKIIGPNQLSEEKREDFARRARENLAAYWERNRKEEKEN